MKKQKNPRGKKETRRMRRRYTRDEVIEMLKFSIGAGKVAIKSQKTMPDGTIRLGWEENGKIATTTFKTKEEVEEFRETFAGLSPSTVAADDKYLQANGSWSAKSLFDLGQLVVMLKIQIYQSVRIGVDSVILPSNTGRPWPTKRQKPSKDTEILELPQYVDNKVTLTRYFDTAEEADYFMEVICSKWPNFYKHILELRSKHLETETYVNWRAKQVLDGSDRTELLCTRINGIEYSFIMPDVIWEVTEGFDVEPCEKLIEIKPKSRKAPVRCRIDVESRVLDREGELT
jgi:hypothetical protein